MKMIGGFLLALAIWAQGVSFAAAEPVIARVGHHQLPPFFWQENGQWQGMDIAFYRALEREAGLTFAFERLPWSRAIEYMKTGKCQIMTQLSKTAEREEYMHFLGPYAMEDMVLVVARDRAKLPIAGLSDLVDQARKVDRKIGIEENAFYSNEFNTRFRSDPEFAASFSFAQMTLAQMVLHDRLFGCFDRRVVISHLIKTQPEYRTLAIHPFQIGTGPVYFGVSKKTPDETVNALRAACDRLMGNGVFKQIDAEWNLR